LAINNKHVTKLYKGIILNIVRFILKSPILLLIFAISLTACGTCSPNKGTIILDVKDKTQTYVTGQDLPSHYKLGNSEQELQRFETFCSEEIQVSQLDGSEETVFENIKHGIHGQIEFKNCSDKVTRIYQY
jgi:predicted small lipoprotein YifL